MVVFVGLVVVGSVDVVGFVVVLGVVTLVVSGVGLVSLF